MDREQVAWLMWCFNEGYVKPEDREGMTNWMVLDPKHDLSDEDSATRQAYLVWADALIAAIPKFVVVTLDARWGVGEVHWPRTGGAWVEVHRTGRSLEDAKDLADAWNARGKKERD